MTDNAETSPQAPSARDVLNDMWARRRTQAAEGLAELLSSLEVLASTPDAGDLRIRAQSQTHQMVGVFGVFGFTDLKNQMACINSALSDGTVPTTDLVEQTRLILAALP
jgi:hypothetical protein